MAFGLLLLAVGRPAGARPVHSYVDERGVTIYFTVSQEHVDIDGVPTLPAEALAVSPADTSDLSGSPYEAAILKHAATYKVDPGLVRAVISAESAFNPVAVSPRGAVGLMQLIPSTARRFGVTDLFHPDQNIEGGVKYLRFLLDMFSSDLRLTLAAYNAGENAVARLNDVPNYRETIAYVARITERYGKVYRPYEPAERKAINYETASVDRIYRLVDSMGNILYTNRPTE